MARTPGFSALRRALLLARAAQHSGVPVAEYGERARDEWRMHRRRFLQLSAAAAGATALSCARGGASSALSSVHTRSDLRVGIVGAGMAGVLCAYRLQQAGVRARVFEAGTRVGGRMFSARGMFRDGQVCELGGEFVDSEHATLRKLATELGITLDDRLAGSENIPDKTFYFAGQVLDEAKLATMFTPIAEQLRIDADVEDKDPARFAALDAMSMTEYLDQLRNLDPVFRSVLYTSCLGEFGAQPEQQSAWNLIWMLGSAAHATPGTSFEIFGSSDERFHTQGGNDLLPNGVAKKLLTPVELEQRLVHARVQSDGSFRLTFEHGRTVTEQVFDKVVFALPWTALRQVQLELPLPEHKRTMIEQLGYGTNAKLMAQYTSRVWREQHNATGYVITDLSPQSCWDTSFKQPGTTGLLTLFTGGKLGATLDEGTADARMQSFLPELDRIFPGTRAAYLVGSAVRMCWPTAPNFLGSYACYKPGQAAWAGSEGEAVGNLHFCGEHTSIDFPGFMEGGADSGERAAKEIMAQLG